jgi:ABC-type transporter Mla subunit MlaD
MALKVLQVVGSAAVVIIVFLLIPVLMRLRRTLDEVGQIVSETRPQTVTLLRKAQGTLDSVNRELENIEAITDETTILIGKVGEASDAVEKAIKSPMTRIGFVTAGAAAAGFAVKRHLFREMSSR